MEKEDILQKAINRYGATAQEDIAIEEMSELTKAILKHRRAGNFGQYDMCETLKNIIEEIADVEICIEYLKKIYGLTDPNIRDNILKMKNYKIERIKVRMERED